MNREQLLEELEKYPDQMSGSERSRAYAKGEEVDHIPYSLSSAETLPPMYGYTLDEFRHSREAQLGMARGLKQDFGINSIGVGLGLKRLGAALGSKMVYPENSLDYVDKHLIDDYRVLDSMEVVNPYENPALSGMLDKIQMYKDEFGPSFGFSSSVAGPLTTAVSLRRAEDILRDMARRPAELERLLSYCVDCTLAWVKAVYETHGVSKISINDPVTAANLISYKQFKRFSRPHLQRLLDGIVDITGKYPGLHICGTTKPIWQDLVEMGFPGFSVDNCEDLEELKNAVGDRMAISGNVPPVDVIRFGTIDDVIESVKVCLRKGADSPKGFSLAIGCQIPVGTPKENLQAYVYAAKKYGRGAKLGALPKGLFE